VHITDGDTLSVIADAESGDNSHRIRVRILGIQAIEMTSYSDDPTQVQGECMAVAAYNRLRELTLGKRVQLSAMIPEAESRGRPVRSIAVLAPDGVWKDVGEILISEGLVLPMPSKDSYTWNYRYQSLAQRAAEQRIGLYNPTNCGNGPTPDAQFAIAVQPMGNGDREYATITNTSQTSVDLSQWYLRDSGYRGPHAHGFVFPDGAQLRPGHSLRVFVGRGRNRYASYFMGIYRGNIFNEPTGAPAYEGDGAYLFDPIGNLRAFTMYPVVVTAQDTSTEPSDNTARMSR
jgi:endonuclease YncB( thermonuclease family)